MLVSGDEELLGVIVEEDAAITVEEAIPAIALVASPAFVSVVVSGDEERLGVIVEEDAVIAVEKVEDERSELCQLI